MHEALVHCIAGARWNPVDHLANLHSGILVRGAADDDPGRVWSFHVEHYRMADRIWAEVDRAISPNRHGAVHVTVLHADVDPQRRCVNCETEIGTGKAADFLPKWAQPNFVAAQKLGALE